MVNKFIICCIWMERNLRNPFRGILDKNCFKIVLQTESQLT